MYYLKDQSFPDIVLLGTVLIYVLYLSFAFGSWRWLLLTFVLVTGLLVIQDPLPRYEPVAGTLESVNNDSLVYRLQDGSRVKIKYSGSNKRLEEHVILYRKN